MSRESGTLIRRFTLFYIAFALVPFGLLFYLFLRHGIGPHQIAVSRVNLGVLILLVGVACLLGFFAMNNILWKIIRLTRSIQNAMAGQSDAAALEKMMDDDGEVAELAKSFNSIIANLEANICELKRTKETLHQVLTKVGNALASMEDLDSLMRLTLETAIEALGATSGVIFSLDEAGDFKVQTSVTPTPMADGEIMDAVGSALQYARKEERLSLLPSVDGADAGSGKPFATPVVCNPLMFRGNLCGAICLAGKKSGNSFGEDEMNIIRNLSSQIAVAFENMRLNEDRERVYFESIAALALAVEARDPYSRGHSERVGECAVAIGQAMKLDDKDLQTLRDAARLHDIGKIGITDTILLKQGSPLTEDEMDVMRRHPVIGEHIVAPLKTFSHLIDPVRHHHERLDGSGYPDGIGGDNIPLITRIIMVSDIFDAMAKARPYRPALGWDATREEMERMVEQGKLDADVVAHLNMAVPFD